jgi:hypothetical protein
LNKDKFVDVLNQCGKMLHSANPFDENLDYAKYDKCIPIWMEEIRRLLNSHTVKLVNDDNIYLIHMREDRDDYAHGYVFAQK